MAGRHGPFMISGLWSLALRDLISRPTRTGLTLIGLAVPILGLVGIFAISHGIRGLLDRTLSQIDGVLVIREGAPTDLFSELPASMAARLETIAGVRTVDPQLWKLAPSIEGRGIFQKQSTTGNANESRPTSSPLQGLLNLIQIKGQDLALLERLRGDVYRDHLLPAARGGGRFLNGGDRGHSRIVISERIARDYPSADGKSRQAGDTLRIGGQTFEIVGVYRTGSMLLDGTIVMELSVARRLLNVSDEIVSCFQVQAIDPSQTEELARRISATILHVDAHSMTDFRLLGSAITVNLDRLLLLLVGIALTVGIVGMLNTMAMSTVERLADFGVLRANGWSRRDVLRLVLAESGWLGLLAGLIGVGFACLLIAGLNRSIEGGIELATSPIMLLVCVLTAVGMGLAGGLYPAWSASRRPPLQLLRHRGR
jgi:putative ABC transport system permease protein